jgi:hypothetical protein
MPPKILRVLPFVIALVVTLAGIAKGQLTKDVTQTNAQKVAGTTSEESGLQAQTSPYSKAAESAALREIRKRAQRQVRELAERLNAFPAGRGRLALQKEIVEIKRDARLELLRTKAHFARRRGELEAASHIEQVIERLINPRFTAPVTTPEQERATSAKGGRP